MNIAVVPFTIEFYDRVLALWKQCDGVRLSSADTREGIRSYLARNPGMSFVAVSGESLVGAVLCGHDGRRGYIHHLSVHPAWRRQGIAGKLVDRCLQALGTAEIRKCHLFVVRGNADGTEFWKSIGWSPRSDIGVVSKEIE